MSLLQSPKLRKDRGENTTSLSLDVVGIKVTRPTRKESGPFKSYYRTIRFEFFGGEMLEVLCSGAIEKYIKLRSVKTLKPVKKPEPINWLTPKVYKGRSEHEQEWLNKKHK